eukprot:327090-Hanusia_phi.AAC.2
MSAPRTSPTFPSSLPRCSRHSTFGPGSASRATSFPLPLQRLLLSLWQRLFPLSSSSLPVSLACPAPVPPSLPPLLSSSSTLPSAIAFDCAISGAWTPGGCATGGCRWNGGTSGIKRGTPCSCAGLGGAERFIQVNREPPTGFLLLLLLLLAPKRLTLLPLLCCSERRHGIIQPRSPPLGFFAAVSQPRLPPPPLEPPTCESVQQSSSPGAPLAAGGSFSLSASGMAASNHPLHSA